ncbi:peptide deformylase [Sphingomonas sp. Leaf34]|uniref:peptide deformylase n=1 Tax=Sphingomonas sp. Leaf34 TaxID=1736216 RepID=UPI0006F36993|nr:peptide deformylase [Sphingomonas sp. Leaf34]KQN27154.1 peptide deformylase [Sphingomonas sp. Leaf34]
MTVMTVLEVPDPRLRLVAEPVDTVDDSIRTLVADMIETMYDFNGIGLAATQVGVQKRVLVIDLQEEKDEEDKSIKAPKAYINAEILSVSDEMSTYNEGCLSIPEQYAEVARPSRCVVKWLDETGAAFEEELDGLLSTCMQHEIDHLDGVLFIDHISRLKRDMVLKKLAKARKLG